MTKWNHSIISIIKHLPFSGLQVKGIGDRDGKSCCFEIYPASEGDIWVKGCKTNPSGEMVQAQHHSYILSAQTPDERDRWVQKIQAAIDESEPDVVDFHKIIESKKAALRLKSSSSHRHEVAYN